MLLRILRNVLSDTLIFDFQNTAIMTSMTAVDSQTPHIKRELMDNQMNNVQVQFSLCLECFTYCNGRLRQLSTATLITILTVIDAALT